jgi:hypothetical protein
MAHIRTFRLRSDDLNVAIAEDGLLVASLIKVREHQKLDEFRVRAEEGKIRTPVRVHWVRRLDQRLECFPAITTLQTRVAGCRVVENVREIMIDDTGRAKPTQISNGDR